MSCCGAGSDPPAPRRITRHPAGFSSRRRAHCRRALALVGGELRSGQERHGLSRTHTKTYAAIAQPMKHPARSGPLKVASGHPTTKGLSNIAEP